MTVSAEERVRVLQRRIRQIDPAATLSPGAAELIARAIRDPELASIEKAAMLADPPLLHRKGALGLWRIRRIEIAERIRDLKSAL